VRGCRPDRAGCRAVPKHIQQPRAERGAGRIVTAGECLAASSATKARISADRTLRAQPRSDVSADVDRDETGHAALAAGRSGVVASEGGTTTLGARGAREHRLLTRPPLRSGAGASDVARLRRPSPRGDPLGHQPDRRPGTVAGCPGGAGSLPGRAVGRRGPGLRGGPAMAQRPRRRPARAKHTPALHRGRASLRPARRR
jgi:hypothetical protein